MRGTTPMSHGHARTGRRMSADLCKRVSYLVLVSGVAAACGPPVGWPCCWRSPGYATAIWPPAGIAFAAILLYGAGLWPGIVLGSFLVNVWTAFDATTVVASLALPTSLGLGTALQALVGVWLVRRVVGFPGAGPGTPGRRLPDAGRTRELPDRGHLGVTSLLAGGIIPWPTGLVHWWTWWSGDTIGTLVVIPLLLVDGRTAPGLAPPPVHRGAAPRGRVRARGHLFCACAGRGTGPCSSDFERWAHTLADTLRQSLDGYLDALHAIESFYASAPECVGRNFAPLFSGYSPAIPACRHCRGTAACRMWSAAPTRRRCDRRAIRRSRLRNRTRRGSSCGRRRAQSMWPSYIEPSAGNESALGYDVASDPDRLMALHGARDTGAPRATGRLMLVQETSQQFGLLIFLPLYSTGCHRTRWRRAASTCTAM